MNDREVFLTLYKAGGDAEIAHIMNSDFSVEDYEQCVKTDEYKKFRKDLSSRFVDNLDSILIGEIYRTLELLKDSEGNLRDLSNHFNTMLGVTEPVIRRKQQENDENNIFGGLKLRIEGIDTDT